MAVVPAGAVWPPSGAVVLGDHEVHEVTRHDQAGDTTHLVDADGDGDVALGDPASRRDGGIGRVHEHVVDQHLSGGEVGDRRLGQDGLDRVGRDVVVGDELGGDLGVEVEQAGLLRLGAAHAPRDVAADADHGDPPGVVVGPILDTADVRDDRVGRQRADHDRRDQDQCPTRAHTHLISRRTRHNPDKRFTSVRNPLSCPLRSMLGGAVRTP